MTINPNSGVSEANRGKYLGFVEEGTTVDGKQGAAWSGLHPRGLRPHYPWAP